MTLKEKREYLARVKRCRVGTLAHDSDLLQTIKTTTKRGKDSEPEEIIEYRVPDKLKAVELDAKLSGEMSELKVKHEHSGQVDSNVTIADERKTLVTQAVSRLTASLP